MGECRGRARRGRSRLAEFALAAAQRRAAQLTPCVCSPPSRMAAHGCVALSARSSIGGGLLGASISLDQARRLSLDQARRLSLDQARRLSLDQARCLSLDQARCHAVVRRPRCSMSAHVGPPRPWPRESLATSVHARRWSIEASHSAANVRTSCSHVPGASAGSQLTAS